MGKHKKLNESCIKIFQFIKLLYEDKAFYKDVTDIFRDELDEQTNNNIQVCLNKYINAMKVFGIKIVKQKGKYRLLSSLYSMKFSIDDIKAMGLLLNSVQKILDGNFALKIGEFVETIEFRMNSEDKNILNNLTNPVEEDLSFYYKETKKQIEECEKACEYPRLSRLVYLKNNKELSFNCYPQEVIYDSKKAYLRIYNAMSRQISDIPLTKILSLTTLPSMYNRIKLGTTVVYKLKNRLAKTYKLKENEYTREILRDGSVVIVNSGEPYDQLIQRLMRYSFNCEIITPKSLRNKMIEIIDQTIENYTIH